MSKDSTNNKPHCPQCGVVLSGCPCGWRKANDGKHVHASCLNKYNYILNQKEKEKENDKE